jgi:hypothetical protein
MAKLKFDVKTPILSTLVDEPTTGSTGARQGPAIALSTKTLGITETMMNLDKLSLAMKYKAAMILSEIGIDLLSERLDCAYQFYKYHPLKNNLMLISADILKDTIDGEYDLIILKDTIEHIYDKEKLLDRLKTKNK